MKHHSLSIDTNDYLSNITGGTVGQISRHAVEGAKYGFRYAGQGIKQRGWLGEIKTSVGDTMTEYSRTTNVDGRSIHYPLIVPTLSEDEVQYLQTYDPKNKMLDSIEKKAFEFATKRFKAGKSPFWEPKDGTSTQRRK
jgi:hypothetical protein